MPTTPASWLHARRRPARLPRPLVAAALLALAAPACASSGDGELDSGSAAELAAGAETLAGFLDADASCDAIEQAEALLVQARDGQAAGEVPDDVVARVEVVTTRVTDEVTCEPDPEPEPADTEPSEDRGDGDEGDKDEEKDDKDEEKDDDDDDEGNDNDGKGKGNGGNGRGNEGRGRGAGNKDKE